MADEGEKIIFGGIGRSKIKGAIGKGQCPLCHAFEKAVLSERAPNLWGIPTRRRLHERSIDYIAESHVCPSCYVVGGFGVRGTDNRESPMPAIHTPPISLTLEEFSAIDTWLFLREGIPPPSPYLIEAAHRKVTPDAEWPALGRNRQDSTKIRMLNSKLILTGDEPAEVMLTKATCVGCHIIPGVPDPLPWMKNERKHAPRLIVKSTATRRINDPQYKGNATPIREYVLESILDPDRYVVEGYEFGKMPSNYGEILNAKTLDRMIEY